MIRWMVIAAFALAPAAQAQQRAHGKAESPAVESTKGEPPKRIRSVLLYGDEKCPTPTNSDEIVVCARGGESPYRIPKNLRELPESPTSQAWGRRAELIEEVNRAGLPNSCSPIGSGGQTGCTAQLLRQWAAEQGEKKAAQAKVP